MGEHPENQQRPDHTYGINAALTVIGGKWPALILYALEDGTKRYNQILKEMDYCSITRCMLTKELRKLESHGLVTRTVYSEVPPKVEYSLTEKGQSIMPILDQLCLWGCEHLTDDVEYICE